MKTPRIRLEKPALLWCALALAVFLAASASQAKTNPYAKPNNSWISISGKVSGVTPNTFTLDYGKGVITVEMDDGDRDADAYKLVAGDKVTVHGRIDDDLFETTTIEASSVYIDKLGTYFYASSVDEEDYYFGVSAFPVIISSTILQGTVTEVGEDQFKVNTGLRTVNVGVDEMSFNPLDEKGLYKVDVGDVVRVSGTMDVGFFKGHELVAESVVTISR